MELKYKEKYSSEEIKALKGHFEYSIQDINSYEGLTSEERSFINKEEFNNMTKNSNGGLSLKSNIDIDDVLYILVDHFEYSIQEINSYDELTDIEKSIISESIFNDLVYEPR